jgi:hypothetical protein
MSAKGGGRNPVMQAGFARSTGDSHLVQPSMQSACSPRMSPLCVKRVSNFCENSTCENVKNLTKRRHR